MVRRAPPGPLLHLWERVRVDIKTANQEGNRHHGLTEIGPEVGDEVTSGEPACEIESVKAVSDVYSPVSGEVVEVNEALEDAPEEVNGAPYQGGWLFKVKIGATVALDDMLSAEEYKAQIQASSLIVPNNGGSSSTAAHCDRGIEGGNFQSISALKRVKSPQTKR